MIFIVLLISLFSVGYLLFRTPRAQTYLTQWAMAQLSATFKTKISVGGVNISLFRSIVLEKVLVEDQHHDTLIYIGSVKLQIDSLKFSERKVHFGQLGIEGTKINILKDSTGFNYGFLLGPKGGTTDTTDRYPWKIAFDNLSLSGSKIRYKDALAKDSLVNGINFNDLEISKINLSIVNIHFADSATTFLLDNASFSEKSGFGISGLRFTCRIDPTGFGLSNLTIVSNHSNITAKNVKVSNNKLLGVGLTDTEKGLSLLDRYLLDCDFNESIISLTDLSYILPEIWGMDEPILFSGRIKGTLGNLKLKKINLNIGKETHVNADLELQGLPNWKNTFIFLKLYDNTFNFDDLAAVRLPDYVPERYLKIPKVLLNGEKLTYQGNFTGFPSDFVAYGTLGGSLGKLSTDIAIRPKVSGAIGFKGSVKALSFEAGKLLGYAPLGPVSLDIKVNGASSGNDKFYALIAGNIDSVYFNNYRIGSIYVNGKARDRSFEGELKVKDENLKMDFAGKADFEGKIPEFNFAAAVGKANLLMFGLDKDYKRSEIAFKLNADFTGDNIDNVNGHIGLHDFNFIRDDKSLLVKNLEFNTSNSSEKNNITLRSDIADATIDGKYVFGEFDLTFRDYLHYFLPSAKLPFSDRSSTGKNSFQYEIRIKKAEELGRFFVPGLEVKSPVVFTGSINSDKKTLTMDGAINEVLYNQHQICGLTLNSRNVANTWSFKVDAENALIGGSFKAENFSLNNTLKNDSLNTTIAWNNTGSPAYSGKVDLLGVFSKNSAGNNLVDFYLDPSKIWVSDSLWQIEKSHLHIDSTSISIDNFRVHHNQEQFRVFGKVTDNTSDKINLEFNGVKLNIIDLLLGEDIGIDGELNGTALVADPYHSFFLTSQLKIADFVYLEENFGDIFLDSSWDQEKSRLNTSLKLVKNSKPGFVLKGYYEPQSDSLNYHTSFKDYPLESLLPILNSFANKVEGIGNGDVDITGKLSWPKFNGNVAVTDTKIGIDYTKVVYSLSDTVRFSGDSIIFKNIVVSDPQNNTAKFNGAITHNLFGNMTYNLFASTSNIMVLNTTVTDNNLFYGIGHASGMIKITGRIADVKLDMSLTTKAGTQISVPLENPESVNEYDFIRFVNHDALKQEKRKDESANNSGIFELDLDITATPDAKVQMIFNSTVGDAINGSGSGDLKFIYDKEGNFFIYGDYKIDRGDYMFTLQNVLVRKFRIEQGGVFSWNGNPYSAIVDLDAVYSLKAPVNNLLPNSSQNDNSRRIPVECKINLSKKLLKPAVKFDINFPTADERTKDELQQFISTQDDINRQMVSLLVMGQFFTPEYLRGRQDFQSNTGNLVGSTTSDILSKQLSNWLSQISNDFDIGFNYRPGDQVNANQMELALSTQILNDRVTINGNIGNNGNLQSNTNNPVVGEVELFIKLTKSGKLQLKAYNRANDDLIYDTSLYKQGIGLSFSEEFNTLGDLFNHYRPKRAKGNILLREDSLKGKTGQ